MGGFDFMAGERHPRALLTDHEIDLCIELHAGGMSLSVLASKFEVSKGCVAKLVSGQRRSLVITDEAGLRPARKCTDPLPQLCPREAGHDDGMRAMVLIAAALSGHSSS